MAGGGGGGGGHNTPLGGGMFGKESQTYDVYLNLTPLMDVMSNILFFLLAAFGATVVAILPATVPTVPTEDTAPKEVEEDSVTVTVRADAKGLSVNAESDALTREQTAALRAVLPKKDGQYDLTGLTTVLMRIKDKYRASSTMILVPDDDIKYETVVKLLDAARDTRLLDTKGAILFPNVVFSSIATHDAEGNALK